ncbi:uncharacterized protein ATNIH1004_003146 [Aspergillus tanneri]|uniref:Uncharacterized protein n=1 Tax=Aspergillus tanneri TaxID=1220188 RepID=A0A5M9MYM0_9EURO|nr:uncharacterized protein ATNIH1004_003146 [Aspergillus tanneri]KAA8650460.1 hypothetical protein ATNIH1004_003146 [Aspergillus tanneri]
MKIWTFLETVDSTFTITDSETGTMVEMHVPITSIRSALLDFEHEKEIPLAADHVGTACFKGQESTTRVSFINELKTSVSMALHLSKITGIPLHVEKEITIQVNGFFEDTARGVRDDSPLKLWASNPHLFEYLTRGPSACLQERLKTGKIPPGSFDDSSVSSFESRPSSARAKSVFDFPSGTKLQETGVVQTESIPSGQSVKKCSSFVAQFSPRIHITEPTVEGYFTADHKSLTSDLPSQTPRHDCGDGDNEVDGDLEQQNDISVANFVAPSQKPGCEKLLWIHAPYTHSGWVPPILSKACEDRQRPELARHLEPHARFVRPNCIHFRRSSASLASPAEDVYDPQLALYIPYLHWDTYWNLLQRRKAIEQRLRQGRSKPVPDSISKASIESKLIWEYLGSEPPIHIRRTLDQFGYPNLRSTAARDDDQMLWKRTKKPIDPSDKPGELSPLHNEDRSPKSFMDGKVLMVDQLWLWIVDRGTVVSFFPKQEATTAESKLYEQTNLYNSIYNELNGDLARRFETAGDLAALIVLHAVTVLLDRTLHHDLQTESMTKSFKRFRSRGFITRPADCNKTPDGKTMTTAERNERDHRVASQNREDLSTLLELRDIVDELGTILKLLEQQTTTIKTMSSYFEERGYGKFFIAAALDRLDDYRNQVLEMKENAHSAQKAVENLLDLKQKQANVDEARMARWQAEVTQDQSQSVMMLTIAGPISAAVIIIALLMAFSERLRESATKAQQVAIGMTKDLVFVPIGKIFRREGKGSPSMSMEITNKKDRFGRYLGHRHYKEDEDIWDSMKTA